MNRVKWLLVAGAIVSVAAGYGRAAFAAESAPTLEELDQKLRVIERKLEIDAQAAEEKKKASVSAQAGADGLGIKSADGNFALKFRGLIQADSRVYLDDQRIPLTNTFLLRRVRPILEGTLYKDYDFNFTPDFAGSAISLLDAYIDYHPSQSFRVRVGKFKAPVGLERLQSISAALFTELAFPTALAPNRDIGLQVHGDVAGGILNYAVGLFTGTQDGASNETDGNDSKDVAGRIFIAPFKNAYSDWARGLSFGAAGTYGTRNGALASYRTSGQQTFFTYLTTVTAEGTQWRFAPQITYYKGRFGLIGEYILSTQEVKHSSITPTFVSNQAWQIAGSFLLTGDKASFRGVTPVRPFDPKSGQWGALELAARYTELIIDDAVVDKGFVNLTNSARRASAWAAGVNWYLNKALRVQADYEETAFVNGAARNFDREKEKVVFTRFQVAF